MRLYFNGIYSDRLEFGKAFQIADDKEISKEELTKITLSITDFYSKMQIEQVFNLLDGAKLGKI